MYRWYGIANAKPLVLGGKVVQHANVKDGYVSSSVEVDNAFQTVLNSGKVTKTAINKIPVAELRKSCRDIGLPPEGLKAELVERLLNWALASNTTKDSAEHKLPDGRNAKNTSLQETFNGTIEEERTSISDDSLLESRINQVAAKKVRGKAERTSSTLKSSATPKPSENLASTAEPKDIRITWLGTSSGAPTNRRNVSCIAVRYGHDRVFLVDSGEGTRNQMRNASIDPALVTDIFITHLHGDHCFGIAGTLIAISNARAGSPKEREPVRIYGPQDLQRLLIASIRAAGLQINIPIVFIGWVFDPKKAVQPPVPVDSIGNFLIGFQAPDQVRSIPHSKLQAIQNAYDGGSDNIVRRGLTWTVNLPDGTQITAAQLQHRMPCWGYVFQEPDEYLEESELESIGDRHFHGIESSESDDDVRERSASSTSTQILSESDISDVDNKIRPGRKLVLLGDTCDSWAIAEKAAGCDVISHEATFNRGMEEKARIATHSTAEQAGAFAKAIGARALVLTHFSARYEQLDKYTKMIRVAKAQDTTVGRMQSNSVSSSLREEASAVAGSTRVYLANDYYTFHVTPHPIVTETEYRFEKRKHLEEIREVVKNVAPNARPSKRTSPGEKKNLEARRGSYTRGGRKNSPKNRERSGTGRRVGL